MYGSLIQRVQVKVKVASIMIGWVGNRQFGSCLFK
jgi:hypothetical protein